MKLENWRAYIVRRIPRAECDKALFVGERINFDDQLPDSSKYNRAFFRAFGSVKFSLVALDRG
jgi:hypothetical protein